MKSPGGCEVGPGVYNTAIADARAFLEGRLADLEAVRHEEEFAHCRPQSR